MRVRVLGHPRLDAGVAHLARPARPPGAGAGRGERPRPRRHPEGGRVRRARARLRPLAHLRRALARAWNSRPGSDEYFVCDMGSGARPFGAHVLARQSGRPAVVNIFMSHMHWDHIMGFPFFGPAYVPGTRLRIYGCHADLEDALRRQQEPPSFPVEFAQLTATIEFVPLVPGETREVAGVKVTAAPQFHSGDSYGYRFEHDGKSFVYSTDSEHKLEDRRETERFVEFFRGADLVIFDAMYSLAEAISVKADWGHSSNVVGVELCQMAQAKHLVLFHHEPANNDSAIDALLKDARRLRGAHAPATRPRGVRGLRRAGDRSLSPPRAPPRSAPWSPCCSRSSDGRPRRSRRLRDALFDAYQRLLPRERISAPATIVEIDEETLADYGQWPWPRTRVAELDRAHLGARARGDRPRPALPRARPLLARRGFAPRAAARRAGAAPGAPAEQRRLARARDPGSQGGARRGRPGGARAARLAAAARVRQAPLERARDRPRRRRARPHQRRRAGAPGAPRAAGRPRRRHRRFRRSRSSSGASGPARTSSR